jgi:hypothetical protein
MDAVAKHGAREAPITVVVAITTGRDAKKSSLDEAPAILYSADDPTTRMRQITESPTPAVPTRRLAGTCSQPTHRQPRGQAPPKGRSGDLPVDLVRVIGNVAKR